MSAPERRAGYETTDAHAKPLAVFAVVLAVVTFLAFWASRLLEHHFDAELADRQIPAPMSAVRRGPDPPLLQATTRGDLAAHRAHEDTVLHTYGWIDRDAGIVHLPIERAMELFVERRGASSAAPPESGTEAQSDDA